MNQFLRPKSLMFYGGTLAFVVVLFSLVTAYGETHLEAPALIEGRYSLPKDLPGCLQARPIMLVLWQSGVYLNGAMIPADAHSEAIQAVAKRPPLQGDWRDGNLSLGGALANLEGCQGKVIVEGTIQGSTLTGTLSLTDPAAAMTFSANREKPETTAPSSH